MKHPCEGKVRFSSWDEASLALVDAKIKAAFRRNARRQECRSYYCGDCNGFHLTSTPDMRRRPA